MLNQKSIYLLKIKYKNKLYIKIGYSKNYKKRLLQLNKNWNIIEGEILFTKYAYNIEKIMHEFLKKKYKNPSSKKDGYTEIYLIENNIENIIKNKLVNFLKNLEETNINFYKLSLNELNYLKKYNKSSLIPQQITYIHILFYLLNKEKWEDIKKEYNNIKILSNKWRKENNISPRSPISYFTKHKKELYKYQYYYQLQFMLYYSKNFNKNLQKRSNNSRTLGYIESFVETLNYFYNVYDKNIEKTIENISSLKNKNIFNITLTNLSKNTQNRRDFDSNNFFKNFEIIHNNLKNQNFINFISLKFNLSLICYDYK